MVGKVAEAAQSGVSVYRHEWRTLGNVTRFCFRQSQFRLRILAVKNPKAKAKSDSNQNKTLRG